MKVIDLLNKIANGEELPKRIRIRGVYSPDFDENNKPIDIEDITIWELKTDYRDCKDYYSKDDKDMFQTFLINRILNDEVEIIEEDKKIKKLREPLLQEETLNYVKLLKSKINEIIDYLEENK